METIVHQAEKAVSFVKCHSQIKDIYE